MSTPRRWRSSTGRRFLLLSCLGAAERCRTAGLGQAAVCPATRARGDTGVLGTNGPAAGGTAPAGPQGAPRRWPHRPVVHRPRGRAGDPRSRLSPFCQRGRPPVAGTTLLIARVAAGAGTAPSTTGG